MKNGMNLRIEVSVAKTKPNYRTMAPILLNLCREFYQDPENERAYQEWRAQREAEKHEAS